jgi:Bacterial Ig-like domain (group 3)/FG-GAP-like repeat
MLLLYRQMFSWSVRTAATGAVVLVSVLAVSTAGATAPALRSMSTFPSGGVANYTAVADVNRDGKQDVIVSNFNGAITVLPGNGDGTFGAPKTIASLPAGGYPIATADFNHDGIADLVLLNPTRQSVSIYLGNGDGTFEAPKTQVVGNSPAYMAVGDVNGDGYPDVIFSASNYIGGQHSVGFTVMLGAGTGYLHAPNFVVAKNGAAGWVLTAGDVNNDGHLDVVTTDAYGDVEVFLGNGDGTFREQASFSVGLPASQIVLADFYGKGHLDLATGNFGYENLSGAVGVLEGRGDGSFSQPTGYLSAGYFPAWVSAADMNGDGRPDLVVGSSYSNTVAVFINHGAGNFTAMPTEYATPFLPEGVGQGPLSIGDFNGDKKPDLAVASQVGVQIMLNLGGGLLDAPAAFELGGLSGQMFAADMTGDGHLDLAAETFGFGGNVGAVNLLRGDGRGDFTNQYAGVLPESEVQYGPLAGGSFNGNGKIGAAAYAQGAEIQPAYNNGSGVFTLAPLLNLDQQAIPQLQQNGSQSQQGIPMFLCAGDFNADGYSDFAVLSGDQVDIYLNKHDGTYSGPASYPVGSNPVFIMQHDVNGDGKPDLIIVNNGSDNVSILLGKGNGTFSPAKEYAAGYKPNVVTTGDFNRDGKIDLAIGDSSKISILLGKGDGTFTVGGSYSAPGPVTYVATADLRGMGVEDLLTTSSPFPPSVQPQRMYLLTGNGNGTFGAPQAYVVGANPYWIVAADFNEDGAQDVAVSTYFGSPTVVVLLNQRGTRIALKSSGATVKAGQAVTLTASVAASVAGSSTATGTITFKDGSRALGSMNLAGGKATFSTSGLTVGKHTISAAYGGSSAFNPHVSTPVAITVE